MDFDILVLSLSAVFQITAAFLALKLVRITGWPWTWLLISLAVVAMAFRHVVTLTRIIFGDISRPSDLPAELVALGISLLMMVGIARIARIAPLFHSLRNAQKATEDSIKLLKDSEARYRFLLDATTEGFFVLERGIITEVSNVATEMFGYSREEMIGRHMPEFMPPEFKESAARHSVEGHHGLHELKGLRKDGTIFPLELQGRDTKLGGRQVRVVAMRDAAERVKAEEALRASEDRFARAVRGTNDGIWDWNIVTGEQYLSPRWYDILGYEPGDFDVTQEIIDNMIHPEDRARCHEATDAHLRERVPYDIEFRMLRKDGETIWIRSMGQAVWDESGNPIMMAGAIRDIGIRKEAEENLRLSEERFRAIFQYSPSVMVLKDLEGRYSMVNRLFEEWFGVAGKEIVGKTSSVILPAEVAAEVTAQEQKVIESGQVIEREFEFPLFDGSKRATITTKFPVLGGENQVIGVGTIVTDITEHKHAVEKALESEHRFRGLIEKSLQADIILQDLKPKFVNQAFVDLFGYDSIEEVLALEDISETMLPEDRKRLLERHTNDQEGNPTEPRYERVGLRRDGSKLWVEVLIDSVSWDDRPAVLVVFVDITDRKVAEEGRLRLMTAVEQASEGVVITRANGLIQYANPAFERITGYSREEVLGKNMRLLNSGKHDSRFYKNLWATITKGEVWEGTMTNRKKDGTLYEEEMTISPIKSAGGGIDSFIAVKRDITERSRADELLRASENRYRGLIENSMLPLMVVQHLKPLFANNAFIDQFRFGSQEEVLALPDVTVTMRPQDVAALSHQHINDMKGEFARQTYERIAIRADGTQFNALVFLDSVDWDNSPAVLVTYFDISKQHLAQAALAKSESWNTTILNGTADGIIVMDQEGFITELNPAAENIFGYSAKDAKGRRFVDLLIPKRFRMKHLVGVEKILCKGIEEPLDLNMEAVGLRKDGSEVPVEIVVNKFVASGRLYFSSFIRDITERKITENALIRANRSLDALSQVNAALVRAISEEELLSEVCRIIVQIEDYRHVWVGMAEHDEEKTVRPVSQIGFEEGYLSAANISWADIERGQGPTGRAIRSGKPFCVNNILHDPQFKTWREAAINQGYASSIALPLLDGDVAFGALNIYSSEPEAFNEDEIHLLTDLANNLSYGILSLREAIARQQAEERIKLQQAQLMQADKLVSLGTLVSGVAHEINNPNAIITLNTPSLREFWRDVLPILDAHQASNGEFTLGSIPYDRVRDDIPAMLDDIQGSANRIKVIVDNLNDFARQGVSGERRTISLNRVVESAIVLVGARIRKATNNFHSELSDDLPLVEGNFQELEQVVINLLTNSCDALASAEKAITISTLFNPENHQAMIVLEDEGEGIPQENLPRIKDPFFTTKQDIGGTGLGLSVSHGIIEDHNGSLEFSSASEGGTVATISLPVQIS